MNSGCLREWPKAVEEGGLVAGRCLGRVSGMSHIVAGCTCEAI